MRFVGLPGGEFTMGSPDDETARSIDETEHRVTVSAFQMAEAEVTQKQWQAVMGDELIDCSEVRCAEKLPIRAVSWDEAIQFLNLLSEQEGLRACYTVTSNNVVWDKTCDGYRLPTEAEWEYACRAGSQAALGRGIDALDVGKYARYGQKPNKDGTVTVKSLQPNAWGLYDMHGNVWEWVWDWYGPYEANGAQTDPVGPGNSKGGERVLRGGGFSDWARTMRCAFRGSFDPESPIFYEEGDDDDDAADVGFRVVRSGGRQPQDIVGTTLDEGEFRRQSNDVGTDAERLFRDGQRLMNRGEYRVACAKLHSSLKQARGPAMDIRLNLAVCYEEQGRLASAWRQFKKLAEIAAQEGDNTRQAHAAGRVEALQPRLARLTVSVPVATRPPGLLITRDGEQIDDDQFGRPIHVDAGQVRIEAMAQGYRPFTIVKRAVDGGVIEVEIPELELISQPRPTPKPSTAPGASSPPGALSEPKSSGSDRTSGIGRRLLGIAIGGSGLAALAVSRRADNSESELLQTGGLMLVSLGVLVFLSAQSHRNVATQSRAARTVVPVAGPHSVGVAVSGEF